MFASDSQEFTNVVSQVYAKLATDSQEFTNVVS